MTRKSSGALLMAAKRAGIVVNCIVWGPSVDPVEVGAVDAMAKCEADGCVKEMGLVESGKFRGFARARSPKGPENCKWWCSSLLGMAGPPKRVDVI